MLKNLLTTICMLLAVCVLQAQEMTEAEVAALKAEIAEKEGALKTLQGEIDGLKAKIPPTYGWSFGAAGTLGLNFSQFSKWLGAENPSTFATNIGFAGSGTANLLKEKYFWRNGGNLTIGFTKLDTDTEDNISPDLEKTADAINATSLFGYKLSDKWAASTLAEYRSTFLSNFNDPGYLDVGVGVTWTPISDMVVVIHPLNYNIVFASDDFTYESSPGAKIVANYARALPGGLAWKSQLSTFLSYTDPANLSNWTWINGFNVNVLDGLGVGFELGLRGNRQEGFNNFLTTDEGMQALIDNPDYEIDDLDGEDNPLQTYWLLGFTYNL